MMSGRALKIVALVCLMPFVVGCPPLGGTGGLDSKDFHRVSQNGFGPADNAVDKNDYAWSMEYFQPDGKATGYVYVGTGNDMIGLIYQGISAIVGQGELGDVEARPPEIRRYREGDPATAWERVLDYRDVETEPFQTIGFRHMRVYRAQSDGVNYLYAATFGREATVWRTASGAPGTWTPVWTSGEIGSVRMMTEHNGLLYLALANDAPEGERLGKIWATDGATFWPVMEDAFGNPNNVGVMCLASFNGWLYGGTSNPAQGYEVWKLEGPASKSAPVKVVEGGGPSSANESAITPFVFQDKLYLGNMINPMANIVSGFKAADIIRIGADDTWEVVVGPSSITGYDSGFNHWPNTYIWSMEYHDGWLYTATYDQVSAFFNVLENLDSVIGAFLKRDANIVERLGYAGADLYKTQDGVNWHPVVLDGFGNVGNYGFRTLKSVGDNLYVGTANPFDGCEIWVGSSVD
jgi:hypothetical protein